MKGYLKKYKKYITVENSSDVSFFCSRQNCGHKVQGKMNRKGKKERN